MNEVTKVWFQLLGIPERKIKINFLYIFVWGIWFLISLFYYHTIVAKYSTPNFSFSLMTLYIAFFAVTFTLFTFLSSTFLLKAGEKDRTEIHLIDATLKGFAGNTIILISLNLLVYLMTSGFWRSAFILYQLWTFPAGVIQFLNIFERINIVKMNIALNCD